MFNRSRLPSNNSHSFAEEKFFCASAVARVVGQLRHAGQNTEPKTDCQNRAINCLYTISQKASRRPCRKPGVGAKNRESVLFAGSAVRHHFGASRRGRDRKRAVVAPQPLLYRYNHAENSNRRRVRAVPAVTRAIAILRLLSRSRTPQSLKAIAESLDLVPSTALHIVARARCRGPVAGRSADEALQAWRGHVASGARRAREQRLSKPGAAEAR